MFTIIVAENYDEASHEAMKLVRDVLRKERPVLGLTAGSTPIGLYKEMIEGYQSGELSYRNVRTWNLDEYIGLARSHPQSCHTYMREKLFDHVDIPQENIHIPNGDAEDPEAECERYEASLQDVTIDLQILGLGTDGHIGFNEPGTPFESLTHVAELTEQTRRDNAHYFGGNIELVPKKAISMGLATVMRARRVVVIATGTAKANAVYNMIKGPMKSRCPASALQAHPRLTVIADKEAAQRILF